MWTLMVVGPPALTQGHKAKARAFATIEKGNSSCKRCSEATAAGDKVQQKGPKAQPWRMDHGLSPVAILHYGKHRPYSSTSGAWIGG